MRKAIDGQAAALSILFYVVTAATSYLRQTIRDFACRTKSEQPEVALSVFDIASVIDLSGSASLAGRAG
jgi:hypothetical protein